MDPCLPVDPPSLCGRLPAPCRVIRVAYVTVASSACVLVPDLREVVHHTRLPRGGRLRVCCCGQMALASLPRGAGTFSCLLLSGQPRSRCWFRMSLTIKAHGPFGCLELSLNMPSSLRSDNNVPQLVGGYWPAQLRQLARRFVLPFHGSGRASKRWCRTSKRTCYLVDPASSHMLVSKIKPCMCKYEPI